MPRPTFHISISLPSVSMLGVLIDAIFTSQEMIVRYVGEGSTVYTCLLDRFQKALEFPVLHD